MDGVKRQKNIPETRYQLSESPSTISKRIAEENAQRSVASSSLTNKLNSSRLARARRAERLRQRSMIFNESKVENTKKKMDGLSFWLVVGMAILKDILDIFLHITIVLSIFIVFIGSFVSAMTIFYFFYERVKFDVRKLASFAISGIIEVLPLISMLPMATINLFVIRHFEHKKQNKKLKIVSRTTSFVKKLA